MNEDAIKELAEAEEAAFDNMPAPVRFAINDAPVKLSALAISNDPVFRKMRSTHTDEDLRDYVVDTFYPEG